jgi:hypothetical protein
VSAPRAERTVPASDAGLPAAAELRALASREGIDAATATLYRRVVESPVHGPFIRRVGELCRDGDSPVWDRAATLAIAPGAFHREHPESGADGSLVREEAERIGCPTELVPLASTGTARDNARTLCAWLAARPGRPVILASLSKGGADVKLALAEPGAAEAFANVQAWVNLCGTLDGTPMVDWLFSWRPPAVLTRLYYRLRGPGVGFLRELRYDPGRALGGALRLPPHLSMISVVGFPLRAHLGRGIARRCHRRLGPLGPNDGALVLADVCAKPGLVYPIWGADHYLQPPPAPDPPPPVGEPAPPVRRLIGAILRFAAESTRRAVEPALRT